MVLLTDKRLFVGRSSKKAVGYGVLSVGFFTVAALATSAESVSTDQLFGVGTALVLLSTALSAFQASENGSPLLSLAVVLGTTTGLWLGLAVPLPRYPNTDLLVRFLTTSLLIGLFSGATGYLVGHGIGQYRGAQPIETPQKITFDMAAILLSSLAILVLQLPL